MKHLAILAVLVLALAIDPSRAQDAFPKAQFSRDIKVEVVRQKSTKFEGGDWDDRTEKLSFKVTLQNSSKYPYSGVEMEFFLFGQSMVDTKAYKLMQLYKQTLNFEPLKPIEIITPQVTSKWDDTVATFGAKYKGWIIRFLAPDGSVLIEKSTSSFFTNTGKLGGLAEGSYYSKSLEEMPEPQR